MDKKTFKVVVSILDSEQKAAKFLDALFAAGYACVPIEPTNEMLEQGWYYAHDEDAKGTWRAMIEAALN